MPSRILNFLIVLIIVFFLDYIWLSYVANGFFKTHLGYLMREEIKILPALLFYLFFAFGLYHFVVSKSIPNKNTSFAAINGALFGFICYASFDLTCYAVFNKFPLEVVFVDLIWASSMSTFVCSIDRYFKSK